MDEKKTLLVLNPAAGKGLGKKNYDTIYSRLSETFKCLDTRESGYCGHLFEIGKEAAVDGYQRIISIGGDGTPFEIINGLYVDGKPKQEIEMGMIPAGTGNSFLRDFGEASQQHCLDAVLNGNTRPVDLVEIQYHSSGREIRKYYINIMGVGLVADILKLTNERLKFLGAFGYSLAVLIRLFKGMNNRITVTVDGEQHQLKDSALVISNSKYTGGEMKIAPMADTGDGKVDMVVFNEVNRREIIAIFRKVFKGKHIQHPKVKTFSGIRFELHAEPCLYLMADGELLGKTPIKLKVLPGELSVLV
ncbi:MAG: diacylglycerol kinase family lipid kinase [bacterium]|nr:diacylglycerol kinase family lipid kinase [bacterium]